MLTICCLVWSKNKLVIIFSGLVFIYVLNTLLQKFKSIVIIFKCKTSDSFQIDSGLYSKSCSRTFWGAVGMGLTTGPKLRRRSCLWWQLCIQNSAVILRSHGVRRRAEETKFDGMWGRQNETCMAVCCYGDVVLFAKNGIRYTQWNYFLTIVLCNYFGYACSCKMQISFNFLLQTLNKA